MKVFTALNNPLIKKGLQDKYKDLVFVSEDISYKEGVFDALKAESPDAVIITNEIQGRQNKFEYITQIRETSSAVKIIIILPREDKGYEEWLASKGVYDIFIDSQCFFSELYDAVISKHKVIVKKEIEIQKEIEYIEKEREIVKVRTVKEIIPVNFNRQVVSVYDNAELAVELAYNIAKMTAFKVLLINLDFSSSADIYLNISEVTLQQLSEERNGNFGLRGIKNSIESDSLTQVNLESFCVQVKGADNLYMLTEIYSMENFEKLGDIDINFLLELAYRNFDMVLVTINKSIFNELTRAVIKAAHINIVGCSCNLDKLREYIFYMNYFNDKLSIPLDKTWYIAWNYNSKVNLPLNVFRDYISGNYAGLISYSEKREKYININSKFAKWSLKYYHGEYIDILSKFNIVPKRTVKDDIKSIFARIRRRLKSEV